MLILASQSPRRAELLCNAGIPFEVCPANVDESMRAGEAPQDYVTRLAREKALAVLTGNVDGTAAGALVLGADTTVVVDGESLGKPVDAEDAHRMLRTLSGRVHVVMTGVCLAWRDASGHVLSEAECEVTEVEFAPMSTKEIAAYVATGEPMDKAGAYGIQGKASRWIPRIRGCYFNVVGLPVARVCAMLHRCGASF
jgi:septum formation protein